MMEDAHTHVDPFGPGPLPEIQRVSLVITSATGMLLSFIPFIVAAVTDVTPPIWRIAAGVVAVAVAVMCLRLPGSGVAVRMIGIPLFLCAAGMACGLILSMLFTMATASVQLVMGSGLARHRMHPEAVVDIDKDGEPYAIALSIIAGVAVIGTALFGGLWLSVAVLAASLHALTTQSNMLWIVRNGARVDCLTRGLICIARYPLYVVTGFSKPYIWGLRKE